MKHLLSIDGGGIRGIIPARLLVELQKSVDLPTRFDMMAGTSTGGIIAVGLAAGISPVDLLDLYVSDGTAIFDKNSLGGLLEAKYHAGNLETKLKAVLGTKRLADIKSPEVLIPSYCCKLPVPVNGASAASLFFRSWVARNDPAWNWPLWEVCRATSAAPTYFPAATIDGGYIMVDGGVFANNPAMCALAAAWNLWPGEPVKILSLGTGSKVTAVNAGNWGGSQWLSHIFSVFMDGDADAVSYQCDAVLGTNFMRCETDLIDVDDAFDDASPDNIQALKTLADAYVAKFLQPALDFLA